MKHHRVRVSVRVRARIGVGVRVRVRARNGHEQFDSANRINTDMYSQNNMLRDRAQIYLSYAPWSV